jgi:hypothetical protein
MMVNKFLQEAMPGLTAKVFRTYNASWTFVQQLADTPADASIADKLLHYNRANRMVAVLCNHQKSVGKNHADVMTRLNDKVSFSFFCFFFPPSVPSFHFISFHFISFHFIGEHYSQSIFFLE